MRGNTRDGKKLYRSNEPGRKYNYQQKKRWMGKNVMVGNFVFSSVPFLLYSDKTGGN